MRGTRSRSAISALLPIRCNIIQHAISEPTASPSGRACAVTSRWSAPAMAPSIASRAGVVCEVGGMVRQRGRRLLLGFSGRYGLGEAALRVRLLLLFCAPEQFVDTQFQVLGLIDL